MINLISKQYYQKFLLFSCVEHSTTYKTTFKTTLSTTFDEYFIPTFASVKNLIRLLMLGDTR